MTDVEYESHFHATTFTSVSDLDHCYNHFNITSLAALLLKNSTKIVSRNQADALFIPIEVALLPI